MKVARGVAIGIVCTVAAIVNHQCPRTEPSVPPAPTPNVVEERAVETVDATTTSERVPSSTSTRATADVTVVASPTRIHGRVVTLDGEVVRGGVVRRSPIGVYDPDRGLTLSLNRMGLTLTGQSLGPNAATDNSTAPVTTNGEFEIDVAQDSELMYVGDAQFITVLSALVHPPVDVAHSFEIVVGSNGAVEGTLVDEDGKPVTSVRIRERFPAKWLERYSKVESTSRRFVGSGDAPIDAFMEAAQRTRADEGKFSLPALFVAGATIEVSWDGEVVASVPMPDAPTSDLRIVVAREHVRGIVLEADGTPAVGAFVVVGWEGIEVDALGRFDIAPGVRVQRDHRFTAMKRGHAPFQIDDFGERWHAGEFRDGLRIVLDERPLSIRGRLVDAKHEPVAGWEVHDTLAEVGFVMNHRFRTNASVLEGDAKPAITDARGWFGIDTFSSDERALLVRSPQRDVIFETHPVAPGMKDLVIGVPADVIAPLVRGRVVTASGEPVGGVEVEFDPRCVGVEWLGNRGGRSVVTDDDGRFEFADVLRYGTQVRLGTEAARPKIADGERRTLIAWSSRGLVLDERDQVTFVVSVSAKVEFEIQRLDTEADGVAFVDASGRRLEIWEDAPRPLYDNAYGPRGPYKSVSIQGNQTFPLEVGDEAAFAIVLSGERELARIPVHLKSGASDESGGNLVAWRD